MLYVDEKAVAIDRAIDEAASRWLAAIRQPLVLLSVLEAFRQADADWEAAWGAFHAYRSGE